MKQQQLQNPGELFAEALAVSTLTEAEKLRIKFMKQHNMGIKAWYNFVEHVEAARVASERIVFSPDSLKRWLSP